MKNWTWLAKVPSKQCFADLRRESGRAKKKSRLTNTNSEEDCCCTCLCQSVRLGLSRLICKMLWSGLDSCPEHVANETTATVVHSRLSVGVVHASVYCFPFGCFVCCVLSPMKQAANLGAGLGSYSLLDYQQTSFFDTGNSEPPIRQTTA